MAQSGNWSQAATAGPTRASPGAPASIPRPPSQPVPRLHPTPQNPAQDLGSLSCERTTSWDLLPTPWRPGHRPALGPESTPGAAGDGLPPTLPTCPVPAAAPGSASPRAHSPFGPAAGPGGRGRQRGAVQGEAPSASRAGLCRCRQTPFWWLRGGACLCLPPRERVSGTPGLCPHPHCHAWSGRPLPW